MLHVYSFHTQKAFHMAELFKGKKLMKKNEESLQEIEVDEALSGKVTALYFSSNGCGNSKKFTPQLKV